MAENETKKKSNAASSAKSAAKSRAQGAAKRGNAGSGVKTATSASKAPAKSGAKSAAKGGSGGGKTTKDGKSAAKTRRKSEFAQQFLPYILGVVVLILVTCFVLDAVGGAETPSEHLMGFVGFYFCQLLFGCFGWAAYLIPLFLVNLIIFWKRNYEDEVIPLKSIFSVVTMLLIAAVTHVVACSLNPDMASVVAIDELYLSGARFESGGVVGGLLGFLLYQGLRLPGTIVVAVLVFPLLILYLIGLTPAFVFRKLSEFIKAQTERAAEERALRRAEEEAAEEADEDEEEDESEEDESEDDAETRKIATAAAYRERRAKVNARAEARDAGADEPDEDGEEESGNDENLLVNPRTGEVMGSAKLRRDRDKSTADAKETATAKNANAGGDEFGSLPFYDEKPATTAAATAAAQSPAKRSAPAQKKAEYAQMTIEEEMDLNASDDYEGFDEIADDESDEPADTMEVGYDDLPDDAHSSDDLLPQDETDDLVPVRAAKQTPARTPRQKHDPYSSVRILENDPTAVTEAGLSEEEVVISSASAAANTDATSAAADEAEPPAEVAPPREYVFPPVDLLTKGSSRYEANEEEIAENTRVLREVLESFRIGVKEISCSCGPTITRFEVKPDSGVRVRSIANLVDDIAMGLAKAGVRIEAPIPGKAAVGIEVPNAEPATVYFRNILETPEFRNHKSRIAACLGADVTGRPVILDINKMPHLLVAGTTGSGKSVCINSIIMSILYKAKPEEVKLILIDPKKVEFAVYRDLPHLYCPIISDPKKAAGALNSAVNEMERRFELIEEVGVRNIAGYNEVTADDPARPYMPQMVIIIDELADLMMTASNEVETAICRLAQKARAAGMHLILGTQRPSTDVITGLIKANVPSRIAFTVTQSIDSRIIIDTVGAEKLIGRGDMLYSPVGTTKPLRVQGTFVSDGEVERVVTFLRDNNERVEFDESFTRQIEIEAAKCASGKKKGGDSVDIDEYSGSVGASASLSGAPAGRKDNEDPKFWEALEVAAGKDKIGTSALQRALNLGYGRAAKIIDRMEELGLVGPDPGTKQGRKVLFSKQDYLEYRANGLPSGGHSADGGTPSESDFDEL